MPGKRAVIVVDPAPVARRNRWPYGRGPRLPSRGAGRQQGSRRVSSRVQTAPASRWETGAPERYRGTTTYPHRQSRRCIPADRRAVDLVVEIGTVHPVDLCGDLQCQTRAAGDLDGTVGTFRRRDPSQKRQIVPSWSHRRQVQIGGQTMMNSCVPVRISERAPLMVRDRNQRKFRPTSIGPIEILQVQSTVQGGDCARGVLGKDREMQHSRSARPLDLRVTMTSDARRAPVPMRAAFDRRVWSAEAGSSRVPPATQRSRSRAGWASWAEACAHVGRVPARSSRA